MFCNGPISERIRIIVAIIVVSGFFTLTGCDFPSADPAPDINEFVPSFATEKPLTVIPGDQQVEISWPAHPDATGYVLYWSTQADFTLATAETENIAVPSTRYQHLGLHNGTTYYYAVGIDSKQGLSLPSGVSAAIPDLPQLPAPTNVQIFPGNYRNTLTWDPVDGASSYSIYWSNNATVGLSDNRIDYAFSPFVHENRENGLAYRYIVVANYREKPGVASLELQASPANNPPIAPIQLTYTRDAASIELQWPTMADETYNLYWSESPGVSLSSGVYAGQLPPFTFPAANSNSAIYYRLQASNGSNSELSFEFMVPAGVQAMAVTLNSTQSAPSTVVMPTIAVNDHQLTLNWDHTDAEVLYYNVYWKEGQSNVSKTDNVIAYVLPPYTHTQRVNGVNVYYRVTAVGAGGEGPLSQEVFQAPEKPVPGVPGNVVTLAGDSWIGISWVNVADAEKYTVYWWQTGDSSPQNIDDASSPTQITSLAIGQDYFVSVQAGNSNSVPATSVTSAIQTASRIVTTKGVLPTAPLDLLATPGDKKIDLSWQASGALGSASSYKVYGVQGSSAEIRRHPNLLLDETENLQFTHSGLNNQASYSYLVSGVNSYGESMGSVAVSAIPQAAIPGAPLNVFASAGDGEVTISWTEDTSIAQYNVYRIAADESKTVFANVSTPAVINANNGESYRFYVSAISSEGQEGIDSIIVSATPAVAAPTAAPANLNVIATEGSNQLDWQPVAGSDVSYRVYISRQGDIDTSSSNYVEISSADGTSYTHNYQYSGEGFFYAYAVTAITSGGEGPLSPVSLASTPKLPRPQLPPADFSATAGDAEVVFNWTDVADADSYTVYWTNDVAETNLANWYAIAGVRAGDKHQQLTNGLIYYYQLAAVNSSGESDTLTTTSSTPVLALPTAPIGLQALAGDSAVNLSWPQQTGIQYHLYWSSASFVDAANATRVANVDSVYNLAGLSNDTAYYFRISAENTTGEGALSAEISATPQAAGSVNQAPVITGKNNLTTAFNTPITITLQDLQYNDPDGDSVEIVLSKIGAGNYTIDNTTNTVTPATGFDGQITVGVTLFDGNLSSNTVGLDITVLPQVITNQAPEIAGQVNILSTAFETPILLQLSDLETFDADGDILTLKIVPLDNANYTFVDTTVTPPAQFSGDLFVTVVVNDGSLDSLPFDMKVTVLAAPVGNTPPRFVEASTVTESYPEEFRPIWNFHAIDDDNDPITWTIFSNASNGQVFVQDDTPAIDTQKFIHYVPNANYFGNDTFVIRIDDGQGGTADLTFNLTVTPINDVATIFFPPDGQNTITAVVGQLYSQDFEIQDIDSDPAGLSWVLQSVPAWATFIVTSNRTGTLKGIPDAAGSYQTTIAWRDGDGGSASMSYSIVVTDAPPVADVAAIIASGFGEFSFDFGLYQRSFTSWDSATDITTYDRYDWTGTPTPSWQLITTNINDLVVLGSDGVWAKTAENRYVESITPATSSLTLAHRDPNNSQITYSRIGVSVHSVIPLAGEKINRYFSPELHLAVPDTAVFPVNAEAYGVQPTLLDATHELNCNTKVRPPTDTCDAVLVLNADGSTSATFATSIADVFNLTLTPGAGPFVFFDNNAQGEYYVELMAANTSARTGVANYYFVDFLGTRSLITANAAWAIETITGTVGVMASVDVLKFALPVEIIVATDSSLDQLIRTLTVWNSDGQNNYLRNGISQEPGPILDPTVPNSLYVTYNSTATDEILANFNPGSGGAKPIDPNDLDSDGVSNAFDAFPNDPSRDTDTDGDGLADVVYFVSDNGVRLAVIFTALSDPDDDNDGFPDYADFCPVTASAVNDPAVCDTADIVGVYKLSETSVVDTTGTSGVFIGTCFPDVVANPSRLSYVDLQSASSGKVLANGELLLDYNNAGTVPSLSGSFTDTYIDTVFSPSSGSYVDVSKTNTFTLELTYDSAAQVFSGTSIDTESGSLDANNQLNCTETRTVSASFAYKHSGNENYGGLYGLEFSNFNNGVTRREVDMVQLEVDKANNKVDIHWIDPSTAVEQIVLDTVSSQFDANQGVFLNTYVTNSIKGDVTTGQSVQCSINTVRGLFVADPNAPGADNVMVYIKSHYHEDEFYNTTDASLCNSNVTPNYIEDSDENFYGKILSSDSFTRTVRVIDNGVAVDKIRIGMLNPPILRPTDTRNLWLQALDSQGAELCSRPFLNDGIDAGGYTANTRVVLANQSSVNNYNLEFQSAAYSFITCNSSLADGTDQIASGDSYTVRVLDPGTNNSKETTGSILAPGETVVGAALTGNIAMVVSSADRFIQTPDRLSINLNGALTSSTQTGGVTPLYGYFNPERAMSLSWTGLSATENVRNYQVRIQQPHVRYRYDTANNSGATSFVLPAGAFPDYDLATLRITAAKRDSLNTQALAFSHSRRVQIKPGFRGLIKVTTTGPSFDIYTEADSYGTVMGCGGAAGSVACNNAGSSLNMSTATLSLSMLDDSTGSVTGIPGGSFTLTAIFTDSVSAAVTITSSIGSNSGLAVVAAP